MVGDLDEEPVRRGGDPQAGGASRVDQGVRRDLAHREGDPAGPLSIDPRCGGAVKDRRPSPGQVRSGTNGELHMIAVVARGGHGSSCSRALSSKRLGPRQRLAETTGAGRLSK